MTENLSRTLARIFTLAALTAIVLFALLPTLWQKEWLWALRLAVFAGLGLWLANARSDWLMTGGITLVLLLLTNQVISPFLMESLRNSQFVTLPPGLDRQIKMVGDVMPGFVGTQHISTDRLGFRTTTSVDYRRKPEGTFRVFAIGGSTTEQIYLDDRKTWTHLLQQGLAQAMGRRVEVINTGVSGLRAVHHLATLRHILPYQPDLVVIMVGINDWNQQILDVMEDRGHGFSQWWKALSYPETVLVFLSRQIHFFRDHDQVPVDKAAELTQVVEYKGEYYSRQNDSLKRKPHRSFPGSIQVSPEYGKAIADLVRVCAQEKLRCVFLNQPTAYDPKIEPALQHRLWMTPPGAGFSLSLDEMTRFADAYNEHLVAAIRKTAGEVCDVAKILPPDSRYFYDDCHYNEGGATALAAAIEACLLHNSLPASPATFRPVVNQ